MLYIHRTPVPPSEEPTENPLYYLSAFAEGDLLSPTWLSQQDLRGARGRRIDAALGSFRYHGHRAEHLPPGLGSAARMAFYLGTGLRLSRQRDYDVIVTYGALATGVAGCILKRLTGTPLVVEVPNNPVEALVFGSTSRLRRRLALEVTRSVIRQADRVKLLYPWQLVGLLGDSEAPKVSVFSDFVAGAVIRAFLPAKPYVLFLGFPWHLKGVDVLLRAFLRIAEDFPEVHLRVVGHCPDRRPYETISGGHPRIHLESAVAWSEAARLISECLFLVLPSRTEGMGRVLLEAMAAGRPVVASRVDGIPYYVKDGNEGLLFRSADVVELTEKLIVLLREPALRDRMGKAGFERFAREYSEAQYAAHYQSLLEAVRRPR